MSSSNIKRCVETMLMDDNIFSIYSIAYVLKHKAKQLGIDQDLFKADYSQLKNVLSAYNSGDAAYNNPEGEKYGTYTLE